MTQKHDHGYEHAATHNHDNDHIHGGEDEDHSHDGGPGDDHDHEHDHSHEEGHVHDDEHGHSHDDEPALPRNEGAGQLGVDATQFNVKVVAEGEGDLLLPGQKVLINYVGTFLDGTVFESTIDNGRPFAF